MPIYSLNPAFVSHWNFKTGKRGNLPPALQCPLASCTMSGFANSFNVPGPFGENYVVGTPPQFRTPYDTAIMPGSNGFSSVGPFRNGMYAAFVGAAKPTPHCLVTVTRTDAANLFLELCDLADPTLLAIAEKTGAAPPGILSAKKVTNGIFLLPTSNSFSAGSGTVALSGYRIVFDTGLMFGTKPNAAFSWQPVMNLVSAELGSFNAGSVCYMSHWSYFAGNPRLTYADSTAGFSVGLQWFYDAGQPPVAAWQLWADDGFGNQTQLNSFAPTVLNTLVSTVGIYFIVGVDGSGNRITPESNYTSPV